MTGEHYGVSRCVGLGNTIDIDEVDVLEFLHKDPLTGAIFIYLESLHRPKEFLKLARKVTREKPVIMLKGGATEGGAEAALSHTASMGSDDSILDGALKQTGVVRVEDFSDLDHENLTEEHFEEMEDTMSLLQKYVDEIDSQGLNKKKLNNLLKTLYVEANEVE